jgi:hypothetical protein
MNLATALQICRNGRSSIDDRCCEEKLHLLFEYRNATNLYSTHVALMAEIAGGLLAKHEFDLLSKAASQAHEMCIEAREHFFKHAEEHGC